MYRYYSIKSFSLVKLNNTRSRRTCSTARSQQVLTLGIEFATKREDFPYGAGLQFKDLKVRVRLVSVRARQQLKSSEARTRVVWAT